MNTIHTPKLRRVQLSAVAALVVFVVITTAVFAQTRATSTVTVGPSKDNTLYESSTGALSNGAGQHIFAGKNNSGAIRRAVLAFDVSGVPTGATIDTVSLKLNMSQTVSGAQTVTLHKLLADWGEGSSVATGGGGGEAVAEAPHPVMQRGSTDSSTRRHGPLLEATLIHRPVPARPYLAMARIHGPQLRWWPMCRLG